MKPHDTKARVEDENVEGSCAAETPEGSFESGQNYAAVESVKAVAGSQLPLLGDRPNQPRNLSFLSKSYGNRNRSFQSGWFDRHPWLHYVERLDAVFCHTCIKAVASNLIADNVFTRYGYNNWKSATEKNKGFRKHEASASHKEAVARYISTPAEVIGDVGELLCYQHTEGKMKVSRKVLLAILGNIRYLATQALPLRGNWNL